MEETAEGEADSTHCRQRKGQSGIPKVEMSLGSSRRSTIATVARVQRKGDAEIRQVPGGGT